MPTVISKSNNSIRSPQGGNKSGQKLIGGLLALGLAGCAVFYVSQNNWLRPLTPRQRTLRDQARTNAELEAARGTKHGSAKPTEKAEAERVKRGAGTMVDKALLGRWERYGRQEGVQGLVRMVEEYKANGEFIFTYSGPANGHTVGYFIAYNGFLETTDHYPGNLNIKAFDVTTKYRYRIKSGKLITVQVSGNHTYTYVHLSKPYP